MTRTMDPRTNKGNAYKVRQTRMESGRKEDRTTRKGSDSVGKDRKRVPRGFPLHHPTSRNWRPRLFAKAPDGLGSARGTP